MATCATQKMKKVVIEIPVDKLDAGNWTVKGILADGTEVPFNKTASLEKTPKMRDLCPPSFQDAMSIAVVRTNPCMWVKIGGKWVYKCW
jgi:hypothetical protein